MAELWNVSSSPHVRSGDTTRSIMRDVIIALLPAALVGVYKNGIRGALVLLISMAVAVASEAAFEKLTKRKLTIMDGSALLTGLLLGMNLPGSVPLWMPVLGSMFAIFIVKQFFGGLGQNFMNPALGARCFLLISFTTQMTTFTYDGVTGATPLALVKAGEHVNLLGMFLGNTAGTIGEVSAVALLLGGAYLLARKVISWHIPVTYVLAFSIFYLLFGGHGFDLYYLAIQICGGGLLLGAIFMATDYVTSPITPNGKLVFGVLLGILTGIFRVWGPSAEGVSYAIIIGNLLVPLIEMITPVTAFGFGAKKEAGSAKKYKDAVMLLAITIIAGVALGAVYKVTKAPIEEQNRLAALEAYKAVCPAADSFEETDVYKAAIDAQQGVALSSQAGSVYDNGKFGKTVVDEAYQGVDASGAVVGSIVKVTSSEGFGGAISIVVGMDQEGVITGINFLELNETAGLGMNADTDAFKSQYIGKSVEQFEVVKTGSTDDAQIDAITGATITSSAVTNAVNTALDFAAKNQ